MNIILKRGTEFTPIVFQHPDLQNKNYCKIEADIDVWANEVNVETSESFNLQQCYDNNEITNLFLKRIYYRRAQVDYCVFTGGLYRINRNEKIIALIVTKNGTSDKYVIVNKEFSESWPTYFSRIKKSMNTLGISSRSRLILMSSDRIYSEFQQAINPTMDDYLPEAQQKLSNEFIEHAKACID